MLRDDELGLKRDFGLEYVQPDPVAHVVFPDGEHFTHWLDLDRTLEEIARFSPRDADAYKRALDEFARDPRRRSGSTASTRSATRRRSTSCCATSRAGCAGSR